MAKGNTMTNVEKRAMYHIANGRSKSGVKKPFKPSYDTI
tara:strand:+ start:325 stop:441 length:117 start_codon:yes stop_codon:yes gene_type:complete